MFHSTYAVLIRCWNIASSVGNEKVGILRIRFIDSVWKWFWGRRNPLFTSLPHCSTEFPLSICEGCVLQPWDIFNSQTYQKFSEATIPNWALKRNNFNVTSTSWIFNSANKNRSFFVSVCGQVYRKMRIVGGQPADQNEFPWMVALSRKGKFYCGATIITKQHLLTAAHCVEG